MIQPFTWYGENMTNAIKLIQPPSHRNRWPELCNASTLEAWRQAKLVEDGANEKAEEDMTSAFGCHGESIANAISDTIHKLVELIPDVHCNARTEIVLKGFQAICDEMTDVRSELDTLIDKMANAYKQEGWDEAESSTPSGCDLQAADCGVDLNTSLEDAFEAGVNTISGYLDGCYPNEVSVSMDDL